MKKTCFFCDTTELTHEENIEANKIKTIETENNSKKHDKLLT